MSEKNAFSRAADWIAQQIAEAATDVRRRVVEEPWFGKPQDGPGVKLADATAPAASDKPYDAWKWSPDPRATESLREQGQEPRFQGASPGETDRGIDL